MPRYVLLKLRRDAGTVRVNGRSLSRHSLFGNVHALPLADALRLIDAGLAKLPRHLSVGRLRDEVAGAARPFDERTARDVELHRALDAVLPR